MYGVPYKYVCILHIHVHILWLYFTKIHNCKCKYAKDILYTAATHSPGFNQPDLTPSRWVQVTIDWLWWKTHRDRPRYRVHPNHQKRTCPEAGRFTGQVGDSLAALEKHIPTAKMIIKPNSAEKAILMHNEIDSFGLYKICHLLAAFGFWPPTCPTGRPRRSGQSDPQGHCQSLSPTRCFWNCCFYRNHISWW